MDTAQININSTMYIQFIIKKSILQSEPHARYIVHYTYYIQPLTSYIIYKPTVTIKLPILQTVRSVA